MKCTCRIVTDYEPMGNTYVARETVIQCDECYVRDQMDALDEKQAEEELARQEEANGKS